MINIGHHLLDHHIAPKAVHERALSLVVFLAIAMALEVGERNCTRFLALNAGAMTTCLQQGISGALHRLDLIEKDIIWHGLNPDAHLIFGTGEECSIQDFSLLHCWGETDTGRDGFTGGTLARLGGFGIRFCTHFVILSQVGKSKRAQRRKARFVATG